MITGETKKFIEAEMDKHQAKKQKKVSGSNTTTEKKTLIDNQQPSGSARM